MNWTIKDDEAWMLDLRMVPEHFVELYFSLLNFGQLARRHYCSSLWMTCLYSNLVHNSKILLDDRMER